MKRIFQKFRRRLRGKRTNRRDHSSRMQLQPRGEQLECRRLLSADFAPQHNYVLPEDVNADGEVSVYDSLLVHRALLDPEHAVALVERALGSLRTIVVMGAAAATSMLACAAAGAGASWVACAGPRRRRSAFAITDTELRLIAAPAIIGLRRRPVAG